MNSGQLRPILVLTVVVSLSVLVLLYVVTYITLGKPATARIGPGLLSVRVYSQEWQERIYRPAAKVESAIRGREIGTAHRSN